ncbi:MAG: mOMP-like family protein [Parachlamydiales bacterium]|nr:mOMP-like family protein [Parachlamydiales bacterium]
MKLTPFIILAASNVIAANSLDQRIADLEQQMTEVRTNTVFGNAGARTVSALPAINSYGLFLSMEMLYWMPFIGGTEFAYFDDTFPVASPFNGNIVEFNFDWQFGVRTALGYQFTNPDWAIIAEYTHVKFHDTEHASHPRGGLSASGLPGVVNETSAEASWTCSFNVFDFDLTRAYFLRPRFSVSPLLGIRTAWIQQRDHAQYFNASTSVSNLLKYVNETAGAGLLGGTGLRWHWSSQWSLASHIAGSLIYGKFKVSAKAENYLTTPAEPLHVKADTYKFLPNMSIDTALQWEKAWCALRLTLAAGYEFQYWWRQNQRLHFDTGTAYSWTRYAEDLGFQGVKFRAALDF